MRREIIRCISRTLWAIVSCWSSGTPIKSAIARSGQSFTPRRSEGMAFFGMPRSRATIRSGKGYENWLSRSAPEPFAIASTSSSHA